MPSATTYLADRRARALDAYWRAANYLSVGQIYLLDNPLLREPLRARARQAAAARALGHDARPELRSTRTATARSAARQLRRCSTSPAPGHGGPGLVANTWLEGSYTERYPAITQDAEGMRRLFRQFSFPGGIPSHVAPETPGSIHEGGELGYALTHAYGAAFDNPDLVVCCVVGDGEAETGPLAASWHSNKFLDPRARRRRAARAAPQRLQDRQPDGARPHPGGRAAGAARGLRPRAALRHGRRPGGDAPGDGGGARRRARRDRRASGGARGGRASARAGR